jgi:hypothetical protein
LEPPALFYVVAPKQAAGTVSACACGNCLSHYCCSPRPVSVVVSRIVAPCSLVGGLGGSATQPKEATIDFQRLVNARCRI